jgi:vacuolar-type H+-ATPase subunit I/STV1
MPFSVEEFRDLVRILEERPEWRAELRRLVLTDEILTLPALVRELVDAQRRTEQRVAGTEQRLAATEELLAALVDAQRRTEQRVATAEDLLAALVDAQRRTEQRVASTEQRLAAIEEQLAALVEAQRRTEQEIAALVEAQRRTEQRISGLTDDMADVKGVVLELRYLHRAHAYFAPLIRRTHVLSGDELDALLEGAMTRGQLSEAEADDILLADLLLRGRRRTDNTEVYVVVEISWKIDPYDVERSVRRATLLSRIGMPTVPVVAGREVIEEAASLANMLQVWQLTNGQARPPHHLVDDKDHAPPPA